MNLYKLSCMNEIKLIRGCGIKIKFLLIFYYIPAVIIENKQIIGYNKNAATFHIAF